MGKAREAPLGVEVVKIAGCFKEADPALNRFRNVRRLELRDNPLVRSPPLVPL